MQIIQNTKQLDYNEFSKILPQEAEILRDFHDERVRVCIDDLKISVEFNGYKNIFFDLNKKFSYHQKFFTKNSFYKDPLAKAIGIKKGKVVHTLVDTTGGTLSDTLLMLSYGVRKIIVFERNPLVAALIFNALRYFGHSDKIIFYPHNFKNFESIIKEADVIYFDPMYKIKKSKTAPKKEMAFFRELLDFDDDQIKLAHDLQILNHNRLVIKRSSKNPSLLDRADFTISGKSTCYDVYLS